MRIWRIDPARRSFKDEAEFQTALGFLRDGALVAIPTETVYGLAADATNADAVVRIFQAKNRPRFNPLICHVENLAAAERHGVFDADARRLAEAFWPGALTLVVEKRADAPVCDLVTAGLDSIALRIPAAPVVHELTAALGRPLAAPSANRSGRVSATSAEDVIAELGDEIAMIIDAGPCPVGVESTIVATVGGVPRLLRPGGIARSAIEEVLGRPLAAPVPDAGRPAAPGMLASHYAPRAAVRLDATSLVAGEALLAFGPETIAGAEQAAVCANLSPSGDLREAARNLFKMLRALDAAEPTCIAVMPIPEDGLGEAIRDRLRRAAAPRPSTRSDLIG